MHPLTANPAQQTQRREDGVYRTLTIDRLAIDGEIERFFPPGSLSWGSGNGELNLHLSQVSMQSLPVVKLLRDLGVVFDSEQAAVLLKVQEPFSTALRAAVAMTASRNRRGRELSPEQLALLQQAQTQQGAEAEVFVLALEQKRLSGHPQPQLIQHLSLTDAAAGYDIESFEGLKSFLPDRFIEVKSYRAVEHFFLSSGEMAAARELGDRYYLYLVDMEKIDSPKYLPTIIRNPADEPFDPKSCWSASAVNFEVVRKMTQGRSV